MPGKKQPEITGPHTLVKNWGQDVIPKYTRETTVVIVEGEFTNPDCDRSTAVARARRLALKRWNEAYPKDPIIWPHTRVIETIHHTTVQVVYVLRVLPSEDLHPTANLPYGVKITTVPVPDEEMP